MRRGVAVPLLLLVPIGLLMARNAPIEVVSKLLRPECAERPPTLHDPSVQFADAPGQLDPLISPIIPAGSIDSRTLSQPFDFTHGDRATFHPHGETVCASGCAASRHPTETLTSDRFASLLLDYAKEPVSKAGPAQDALLYFGRQAARLLATEGSQQLDPLRTAILQRELARDHAEIEIRVVDALERVRASLPATRVPLDRRHEFQLDTHDLQPMVASGTVKRVGRNYLWTRL